MPLPRSFNRLPKPPARRGRGKPRSICLVTGEVSGPDVNGGIGTANLGLALALAEAGHAVDILYTRVATSEPYPSAERFADQAARFARLGLSLMHIEHAGAWNDWLGKSRAVLDHLQANRFDTVLFNDTHGNGYASLLAKQTGAEALRDTHMVVFAHSASQWIFDLNEEPVAGIADIQLIELERRSIELADALISPSRYLLETYAGYGWALPAQSYVHPNVLPLPALPPTRNANLNGPPDELVFFGRLETRKGLWLFCNALDRLKDRLAGRTVTFLGKSTSMDGRPTVDRLLDRSMAWPFDVRIMTNQDSAGALAYLAHRPCVAVMPSVAENSPCAVAECLATGIPFVATSGSGSQELVRKADWKRCLVEPAIDPLTEKLRVVLDDGQKPARLAHDQQAIADHLVGWLAAGAGTTKPRKGKSAPAVADKQAAPAVTAVVLHNAQLPRSDRRAASALADLPPGSKTIMLGRDTGPGAKGGKDRSAFAKRIVQQAREVPGPIVVCSDALPVTGDMLARALSCFERAPDIAAVSGFAGTTGGDQPAGMGPTAALMSIGRQSNHGYAIIRRDHAAAIGAVSPFDEMNDRVLPATVWIHRLFNKLGAMGHRCELLPDLQSPQPSPASGDGFEAFDAILDGEVGDPATTGHGMIRTMAAERLLVNERRAVALASLDRSRAFREIADRTGGPVDGPATAAALAQMARLVGQTDAARDLMMSAMAANEAGETVSDDGWDTVIGPASLRREAHAIRLFDLALQGAVEKRNLDHAWSHKLIAPEREIEMHPNPITEGRAIMIFSGLDLSRVERAAAAVRLPQSTANPVICRLEISASEGPERLVEELRLEPGGSGVLAFDFPAALQTRCSLILAVHMAYDSDETRDSWVRWTDPVLTPATDRKGQPVASHSPLPGNAA